ncbi:MAG: FAD-dependent oxidoreductase, partial [Trebonia sp.]
MAIIPNMFPGEAPRRTVEEALVPPITNFPYIDTPFDYGGFLYAAEQNQRIGRVGRPVSVAIVGAGLAGLVAAYELLRAGVTQITIFESAPRVGGRTYSSLFGGAPAAYKAELGAMRFPPTEVGLFHYLNKFDIDWVPNFPDPGVVHTALGYKGQTYDWPAGQPVPVPFQKVNKTFVRFINEGYT